MMLIIKTSVSLLYFNVMDFIVLSLIKIGE